MIHAELPAKDSLSIMMNAEGDAAEGNVDPKEKFKAFKKLVPSYITGACAEKRVGGKRLTGNRLGAE